MPSTSNLSAAFDDFLFATVCEERNEMPLSVISALARLDLDPWAEAAELARMPAGSAAHRLSSLLAGVVHLSPTQPDRSTIAVRLVALLPAVANAAVPYTRASGVRTASSNKAIRIVCLVFLASVALTVLVENLAPAAGASHRGSRPTLSAAAGR